MGFSMKQRIEKLVSEYDSQGWHRTGTEIDRISINWLAKKVSGLGLSAELVSYELDRVDVAQAFVQSAAQVIEGTPLFDCSYTDSRGISGEFTTDTDADGIVLLGPEHWGEGLRSVRLANRASAIVAVTRGHIPGLSLANAWEFSEPFGPPVLQVSSFDSDKLFEWHRTERSVQVVIEANRKPAGSASVVARIAGADDSLSPVVVNTPLSGWWNIAAERGGGIACWIEIMRAMTENTPRRTIIFSANTGHELGFIGLENLLDQEKDLAKNATWVHFGANIGSKTGTKGTISVSSDSLEEIAKETVAGGVVRPTEVRRVPGSSVLRAGGEMGSVARRGGQKYLSLTNDSEYFHMREDRFSNNIDVDVISSYATAFTDVVRLLTQ